jgi:hypothetical protein
MTLPQFEKWVELNPTAFSLIEWIFAPPMSFDGTAIPTFNELLVEMTGCTYICDSLLSTF